nr:MAG TPA: hypothetical protein [Caudoviricetes sp.]
MGLASIFFYIIYIRFFFMSYFWLSPLFFTLLLYHDISI